MRRDGQAFQSQGLPLSTNHVSEQVIQAEGLRSHQQSERQKQDQQVRESPQHVRDPACLLLYHTAGGGGVSEWCMQRVFNSNCISPHTAEFEGLFRITRK